MDQMVPFSELALYKKTNQPTYISHVDASNLGQRERVQDQSCTVRHAQLFASAKEKGIMGDLRATYTMF